MYLKDSVTAVLILLIGTTCTCIGLVQHMKMPVFTPLMSREDKVKSHLKAFAHRSLLVEISVVGRARCLGFSSPLAEEMH